MKVVTVCVVLAAMILVSQAQSQAQTEMRDSDKARVTSLENAWNEAEKLKDAKAVADKK